MKKDIENNNKNTPALYVSPKHTSVPAGDPDKLTLSPLRVNGTPSPSSSLLSCSPRSRQRRCALIEFPDGCYTTKTTCSIL